MTLKPTRPVSLLPEPARFWIALAPRTWRAAPGPWTDLTNGKLGGQPGHTGGALPEIKTEEHEDLFYVPPVSADGAAARDELVERLADCGTPALVQVPPGDEHQPGEGVVVVVDLLAPLLDGRLDQLTRIAAGSGVVWPLIAGLTDQADLWAEGCELLAAAGAVFVQPLTLELTPFARRQLAEGRDEGVFGALFHGEPPSERHLAQVVHGHGLKPFMPRPESGGSQRQVHNRQIAAELAMIAELWMRLDRPLGQGQAIFRAARGAETTRYDLAAVARDENLGVMDWLDAELAELVDEIVHEGGSDLYTELLAEYLTGPVEEAEAGSA